MEIEMTAHELTLKTNRFLIMDGTLTSPQRDYIVRRLLDSRSTEEEAARFFRALRRSDQNNPNMYPFFYIPPYNDGKKLKTIMNQTPKTQLFSSNYYELEVLRLLCLLAPGHPDVEHMRKHTLRRLKTTCFGFFDDAVGECFDASLVVLRFLAAAAPENTGWIEGRIQNFIRHYPEKKRPWFCLWYYWLCLSELPFEMVKPYTDPHLPIMLSWLGHKGMVMHSQHDLTVHPTLMYLLRNTLCRYPQYAHIEGRKPYIREKDGRLCFNMAC